MQKIVPSRDARTRQAQTRHERTRQASQSRREQQKIELRAAILRAADEEFSAHGYEDFSLRRVAERIGYSPTTIYLYFRNKDDLLLQTVKSGFAAFDAAIAQAASQSEEPLQQLENLGRAYLDFGISNPTLYRMMFMQPTDFHLLPRLLGIGTSDEEKHGADANSHRVIAQELLVAAVERGIAQKILRQGDAALMADALWASVHGLVSLAASPLMEPDHARKVAAPLLQTVVKGLKI